MDSFIGFIRALIITLLCCNTLLSVLMLIFLLIQTDILSITYYIVFIFVTGAVSYGLKEKLDISLGLQTKE